MASFEVLSLKVEVKPMGLYNKTFYIRNFTYFCNELVFVPGEPFQPSLMFAGKARAYPSRVLLGIRCPTLG